MNILHINKFHHFRGGAEAVYLNTAHTLETYGHKSIFFSMHHPQNLPCETSNYFMPYVDLVKGDGLINQIKTAGRILYSFEAKKRLSRLLDEYPVDLAHLHNIWHHLSPSILHILKKKNIPIVMTLHDYKLVCASYHLLANEKLCQVCTHKKHFWAVRKQCVKESLLKSMLSTLEMYLHHNILNIYGNVDVFISPSRFLRDKFHEMGFSQGIIHLPNYFVTERIKKIDFMVDNGTLKKENSLTYFGRLSSEKGLITLLEAAKLLNNEKNTMIKIKIIGDGHQKETLQKKVASEKIENVQFLGYMTGENLYREIKKSLATIVPSLWYENNPLAIIESFALGMPVIGARIGGIPELVNDNITGLTFEPGNAYDLKEKITTIVSNNELRSEMGTNAKKFVENELNQERYYQRLLQVYKQVGLKN